MGVWIETTPPLLSAVPIKVTPHMGVWIETDLGEDKLERLGHAPHGRVD